MGKLGMPNVPDERQSEGLGILPESGQATSVELEAQLAPEPRPLHEMRGFVAGFYASEGLDPVDFIRQLRDEWD